MPTQLSPNKLHLASFLYSKLQDLFLPRLSISTIFSGVLTAHRDMLTHLHRSQNPFRAFLGELAHAIALEAVTHPCAACGLIPVCICIQSRSIAKFI